MAWIEPYTTWSNGNRFTYEDANRIAGNINFLYPNANLRENYTQNDFLSASEFSAWQSALNALMAVSGYNGTVAGYDGTAETFNSIESLIQNLYNRIELNNRQEVATIYAGDGLYSATPCENYVRGI